MSQQELRGGTHHSRAEDDCSRKKWRKTGLVLASTRCEKQRINYFLAKDQLFSCSQQGYTRCSPRASKSYEKNLASTVHTTSVMHTPARFVPNTAPDLMGKEIQSGKFLVMNFTTPHDLSLVMVKHSCSELLYQRVSD